MTPLQSGIPTASIPLEWVLWGTIVLLSALVAVALLTVGKSLTTAWRDRRLDAVRPAVRTGVFDRLFADDPAWEEWVVGLDRYERAVALALVDDLLRTVRGGSRRRLVDLAVALGALDGVRRDLREEGEYERLRALTWLTLLGKPLHHDTLAAHAADTPALRAASARLLAEHDDETATEAELDLLLAPGEPLTVLGIDTLARLTRHDPAPLLLRLRERRTVWPAALIEQVLIAARHASPTTDPDAVAWVTELLDREEPLVRAGACDLLAAYGWQLTVRDGVDVDRTLDDPDPGVRIAASRMLARWGDDAALSRLERAAREESDDRARLAAVRGLSNDRLAPYGPAPFIRTVRWVRARRGMRPAPVTDHPDDAGPGLLGEGPTLGSPPVDPIASGDSILGGGRAIGGDRDPGGTRKSGGGSEGSA